MGTRNAKDIYTNTLAIRRLQMNLYAFGSIDSKDKTKLFFVSDLQMSKEIF